MDLWSQCQDWLELLPYQRRAKDFLINRLMHHRGAALFLDMGLGKTATVLSAITTLLTESTDTNNILVIAPKRVSEVTWPQEIAKWRDFRPLKYSVISGPLPQWPDLIDLPNNHLHLVGAHNVPRLVDHMRSTRPATDPWPWDTVIIDESSMFKSRSSQRFKALNAMRHFISRIIIMTGTPSPNGYLDLWSQAFLLDKGERLFSSITRYRDTYFNANPYIPYATPTLKPQAAPLINRKLSDIAISMEQKDYLDLEPIQYRPTTFTPSPTLLKHYDDMRKNMVLNLQGGSSTDWLSTTVHSISAATVAAASNKLLQLTSGVVYDDDKQPRTLCTSKQEAFDDIAQTAFGNHRNMLVFYSFIHERDHILRTYPNEAHLIDEPTEPGQPSIIERWNAGQIPMLVMHPASGGHGLNLQDGGNTVVWYSMTYNLEHWLQGNKRVHRMGQTKPVVVYVLLTQDLIDNHVYNNALTAKRDNQQALIDALKAPMHGQA